MTSIEERREEIEGRLVPGHWEGDLILGSGGASAIGILVRRGMAVTCYSKRGVRGPSYDGQQAGAEAAQRGLWGGPPSSPC